jgi:integrase/recombinase XerD
MMRLDAHNYRRKIERFFEKLIKDGQVSAGDIEILKRYRDYLLSQGITFGRVGKCLSDLKRASLLLGKKYEEADEQDIRRIVAIYEKDEKYSPWSKRDFKVALRKFYTWFRGTKEYPLEVAWMKVYTKIRNPRAAEDMLTEEEVLKLIEYAETPQAKALVATLYESGCRIGELIFLKIGQVKFDAYGAQLFVTGKTGFRRIRIISSVPYLTDWINRQPQKNNPEAFLWKNSWLKPLTYGGMANMLRRIAKKAGIQKRINPHNFRHSRATYLANFLTEAQMKEYFGWQQDSKMAAVYVHLLGRDVDNALLRVYGIENGNEKKESILRPKACDRCQQVNHATIRFCSRRGLPLDQAAVSEVLQKDLERKEADRVLDSLLEDQEFREMFVRKINQVKATS